MRRAAALQGRRERLSWRADMHSMPTRLASLLMLLAGCSGGAPGEEAATRGDSTAGGGMTSFPATTTDDLPTGSSTGTEGGPSTTEGDATGVTTGEDTTTGGEEVRCAAEFVFDPPPGATAPRIAGEWQGFDLASAAMMTGPDGDGLWRASVALAPGLHAYKVVYDLGGAPQWALDPGQGRRKYVDGLENSAVLVRDFKTDETFVITRSDIVRALA